MDEQRDEIVRYLAEMDPEKRKILLDIFRDLAEMNPEEREVITRAGIKFFEKIKKLKMKDPRLMMYTLTDLQEIFHCSRRTLFYWIEDGSLPAKKIGGRWMLSNDDLAEFLAKKKAKGTRS